MKKALIIFIIIFVGLIIVSSRMMMSALDKKSPQGPSFTSTPEIVEQLPDNFVTQDVRGLFEFSYPDDMEYQDDGQVARVYKHGPTQSLGTEVYDGIIVSFYTSKYTGDFKAFVEKEHENISQNGVSEVTSIKTDTLAGKTVYTYSETGLGTFDVIFLPLNDSQYVQITSLVADPGELGFEKIAEQIIQSVKL